MFCHMRCSVYRRWKYVSLCVCVLTPQCNDNLVFSQPRQILILRDMPLPMSFLCLSPPYRCHIPPVFFLPPPSSSHSDSPPWDGNYIFVDTLTPQGATPAFSVLQHLSLSLSLVSLCLHVSVLLCFSLHICLSFSSSSLSTSAPMGVTFTFCPPTNCPCGCFSHSYCTLCVPLPDNFFYFIVFKFSFPFFPQTLSSFTLNWAGGLMSIMAEDTQTLC